MPLVIPGLSSNSGADGKTNDWMNKLTGKKLGESSNETTFAKTELPKEHRVVKDGDMMSLDHKPERYDHILANDEELGSRS
ncbi:hypothetical protein LTR53_010471 [Teratosphaeriaceae sp. CCFEE 6253]|nr:hypothetical protein LTR53_010471 [Teratosphaeriaceae sp. CCFEE 6253]